MNILKVVTIVEKVIVSFKVKILWKKINSKFFSLFTAIFLFCGLKVTIFLSMPEFFPFRFSCVTCLMAKVWCIYFV